MKFNVQLMNAITDVIVLCLSTVIEGLGIVSDFKLHVNMVTDSQFNYFLFNSKFDRNRREYTQLMTKRTKLRRFICRVKNAVVAELELPKTPNTWASKISSAKKSKTDLVWAIENDFNFVHKKKDIMDILS